MTARLPASDLTRPHATEARTGSPCIDRFGTCVSIVVLMATATAIFVVRQNLDDHVFNVASATSQAETTGSR